MTTEPGKVTVRSATRPGPVGIAAVYLLFAGQVARTLMFPRLGREAGDYIALFGVYIVLFTIALWRTGINRVLLHIYLIVQCAITLVLLIWNPEIDSITVLFLLLTYQVALFFAGRTRWIWVTILALAVPLSLVQFLGPLAGLSAGLVPMAVAILIPAIVAANEDIQSARVRSETLVKELQETHRQLQLHAGQVEEIAAMEERSRLARELHDSVSQYIFAITLNTRAAQVLIQREPDKVRPLLEQLQTLAQNALAQMRQLIAQRRP